MEENKDLKLAVLIDADNIPYSSVSEMLEEVTRFGTPTIKRIYGDWTIPTVAGWKPALLEHAITPIQQYGYTKGKNATDSAMIIDAMDILHSEKVDGFCLVSSDSDFTRLATRLRESGKKVIGIGEKKTPRPFIVACDQFIYLEILRGSTSETTSKRKKPEKVESVNQSLIRLLKNSVDAIADDDGWAFLGEVGGLLVKKKPDFDPRNFGFNKLTPLVKSLKKDFEIDERDVSGTRIKHIYIKNK
ncbi:MAG: NYN domain-containing protein [Chitinophagales bacterium]